MSAPQSYARPPLHVHAQQHNTQQAERRTRWVLWITLVTMVVEIIAGWVFQSMALLADGWHMSSHALAIGLSSLAYLAARRWAKDPRFCFGTWKIEILASFASALILLGVALLMLLGSVERWLHPLSIHYSEAMVVTVLGLLVNAGCAVILGHSHDHGHAHPHAHEHSHDLNLRSAYVHVLADAATSVLALAALAGGMWWGWTGLDPLMGVVGALLISRWAWGLLKESGAILLDMEMNHPLVDRVWQGLQQAPWFAQVHVSDLHLWRVGPKHFYCLLTLEAPPEAQLKHAVHLHLAQHPELVHLSVDIQAPGSSRSMPQGIQQYRQAHPHAQHAPAYHHGRRFHVAAKTLRHGNRR